MVAILPCPSGHTLELLREVSYTSGCAECNICRLFVLGDIYHCGICQFDAHPKYVEIEDKVEVFFHHHPLHLLIQYYYNSNLDALCHLCEEPVQQSVWVYRCEECDFDIHALCTKYLEQLVQTAIHEHPLIMIQCHPQNIVSNTQCCNGEKTEQGLHYKCIKKSCVFCIHPVCSSISRNPLCIFDHLHRLFLVTNQEIFH